MRKIRNIAIFILMGLVLAGTTLVFNFDSVPVGEIPQGFTPAQTANRGTLAQWKVVEDDTAPSGGRALMVRPNPKTNYGACYNVLIYQKAKLNDLEISVKIKPISGREDQGGGVLWRAQDENNYYVVRWNPLEDNFRLYYVKNGKRRMLASAKLVADASKWHEIKVRTQGKKIECYFDGELKLKFYSSVFSQAGKFGLWTKADAHSEFDDLRVKELQ